MRRATATRARRRSLMAVFVFLLTAESAGAQNETPFEALREAAAIFVAKELALSLEEVRVPPLDRRARVPECTEALAFRWPFPSRGTVEAFCPTGDARLFLRVIVSKESGPSSLGLPGAHSWVVKSRHQSGDLLKAEDLLPSSKGGASTPSYRGPAPTGPFRLRVLKPLAPGDTVPETAVRLERKVLKAQASLSAKLRLPHPQLREAWVPAKGLAGDTLSPEDLPSLVALARPLRAGAFLRLSDLSSAVLVEKGSAVRVAIEQGLLVLHADLISEEDGALGERVVLVNPETGRRLEAVVTGPGQAAHSP